MIKYFCDRCGKEITDKTNYNVMVTLRMREMSDKDVTHPRIENILCKKCIDGFLKYIENG